MTEAPPPESSTESSDAHPDVTSREPAAAGSSGQRWVPEGPDVLAAAPGRVYNYALGGMDNLRADRVLWDRIEGLYPPARLAARANREFLERVVEGLSAAGIRQFLDIGAGIPVGGATHETLRDLDPTARVVYVDIDPIAVEHARQLLHGEPRAHAMRGDLLDPHQITSDDRVMAFLDLSEPVAVLLGSVLQFLPDDTAAACSVSALADALAPGSFLVITHATPDPDPYQRHGQEAAYQLFQHHTPTPAVLRTAEQLGALIDDRFTLLTPGIVTADRWHPAADDPDDGEMPCSPDDQQPPSLLVAVARLRSVNEPADPGGVTPLPAESVPAGLERGR